MGWWLVRPAGVRLAERAPIDAGADAGAVVAGADAVSPVLRGLVTAGPGTPASDLVGSWPRLRGPEGDGICREPVRLARDWDGGGPPVLWSIELGEGYAAPAVADGRVYVLDYDRSRREEALRCLSLRDGREIWRHAYPLAIKRNHGMSRTVPAIASGRVVTLGSKCHVLCVDAATGERRWALDLVADFGTTVPPWYAGQCPLIEADRVILAPGGPEALLLAVDLHSGEVLWQTENPDGWRMTHVSVVPLTFAGRRMHVYCSTGGVVGVADADGAVLWRFGGWRIGIATIPCPVPVADGRLFLSGGYNAGSMMLQLTDGAESMAAESLFRLDPDVFGATQQTPIWYDGHLFGVRPDGRLVCLDADGRIVWASDAQHTFGLGPFIVADGLLLVMNDSGRLSLVEATASGMRLVAAAPVLSGRESWGPLALVGGRLLARDLTRLVCLDLSDGP